MTLRRALVSKLCAGFFVVLIVLPFTAPFRAWDSGTPIGKASSHDLKVSDELSNSTAIAASTPSVVPVICSVVFRGRTMNGRSTGSRAFQTVLRL
jgi:hypothetical protein